MTLETDRRRRCFGLTPEPEGQAGRKRGGTAAATATTGRFVVQRHGATRLHDDVRLEIEGILDVVRRGPARDG